MFDKIFYALIRYKFLIVIFLLSISVRFLWIFFFSDFVPNSLGGVDWELNPSLAELPASGLVSPDFNQVYDPNARMILEGKGFSNLDGTPTAYVAPGYSFFLAIVYFIFGIDINMIRVAHIFLDSINCILLFFISYSLTKNKISSYATSVVYAIYPLFFYQAGLLITETLFTFTLGLYFLFAFKIFESKRLYLKQFLILGILLGISSMVRPNALILIGAPFFMIFFSQLKARHFISYLFGLLILLAPWIIRNYIYFDQFIPISSIVFNTVEDTA